MQVVCVPRFASTLARLLVLLLLAACGAPSGAEDVATPGATPTYSIPPTGVGGRRDMTGVLTLAPATATRVPPTARAGRTIAARTATAAGVLTVTPAAGPAGTVFTITGAGFPSDAGLYALGSGPGQPVVLRRRLAVGADGLLRVEFNSLGRVPGVYSMALGRPAGEDGRPRFIGQVTFTISEGGPVPTLTTEPDRGSYATPNPALVARGRNFPPDTAIGLAAIQVDPYRVSSVGDSFVVAADGTFTGTVFLPGCDPATPDGTQFRINAVRIDGPVNAERGVASATFVVAPAAPPLPALPTPSPNPR